MLKKTFILTAFILGMTLASKAEVTSDIDLSKEKQVSETAKQPEQVEKKTCTLTVLCDDGSTVSATAGDCATAGAMVDAGCG